MSLRWRPADALQCFNEGSFTGMEVLGCPDGHPEVRLMLNAHDLVQYFIGGNDNLNRRRIGTFGNTYIL